MDSPIADFVKSYAASGTARFHMPGHKGTGPLGCEALDITEIAGADSLYEAEGIIAQSEENARRLFGTGRTLYSTEGSSQCIRAMLHLILQNRKPGTSPVILAARNVHKAFIYAAALLDFQPRWLWPEGDSGSLLGCPISAEGVARAMDALPELPTAVYITSPDYLGNMAEIEAIAKVVHERGSIMAVDNAHGAYLHFLESPLHPMDLGADICCDSAHKTLPVLTGGACVLTLYLLSDWLMSMNLIAAAMAGALLITAYEFCVGLIVNIKLGWDVWDYSSLPYNIMGQICPIYTFVWFTLCFIFLGLVKLLS